MKPKLVINVWANWESAEVGKVTFSRNGGWHDQSLLCQLDVLSDTIAALEDRRAKIQGEYLRERRKEKERCAS